MPIPINGENTNSMWNWLVKNANSETIHFLKDGHYSANWDHEKRQEIKQAILKRIKEKNDIDMILAFGTWAGQDLSKLDIDIPIVVASASNPLESGIIKSITDSGKDNLVASIEPDRYKQQIILFHNIFQFNKLGIVYEDTDSGKSSISLNEIENAAKELNITLLRCTDTFDITDSNIAAQRLKLCHEKLIDQGVEAVYLTLNLGLNPDTTQDVLAPLTEAYIPTFSQTGQIDVQHGALLSISQLNIEEEGIFSATQINEIIQGASPRSLNQIYNSIVSLALNLRVATLIGWNPPLELLIAVDEFFQEIK